jgi:hypothetical protein
LFLAFSSLLIPFDSAHAAGVLPDTGQTKCSNNTGRYQFTPSLDIPNGSDYLIRISAQSGSLQDFSRGLFTITDTPPRNVNPASWNQLLLLDEQ